jgi:NAD(P)-dependent dehydrogenase (short-subunit alcohol dehydrogenase family)
VGALLYASTKGAIETLTRGLALELAPRKIRVNAIAPGHTETEGNVAAGTFEGGAGAALAGRTPLGRLGRVTDIAPLAMFLASDESAWITGEVIRAAGGLVVAILAQRADLAITHLDERSPDNTERRILCKFRVTTSMLITT